MTPTDLALLGLIAALAYYLANARLTLYGWLLTKDMEEPRKDKIWNQIVDYSVSHCHYSRWVCPV
ncbi:MAG: hypothetical protein U0361_04520 [Nitrospiraceae bacterium]